MMKKLVLLLTALTLLTGTAWADSFVQLLPNGKQQFLDANGDPVSGGTVSFYVPNTLTLKDTWQDPGQTTLNSNPVVLDSAGEAKIWGLGAYREIVKDQFGNTLWDSETSGNYGTFQITGGTVDNTVIGGSTPAAGSFTSLSATSLTVNGSTIANGGQVATTAALEAVPLTGLTAGATVLKTGYYVTGDMPTVTYYLQTSNCDLNSGAGDGGAEIPSSTSGNCWHITGQTEWDPRWWGAKGDVKGLDAVTTTTTSGSGTVVVTGGSFAAGDVGKKIVITDVIGDGVTAAGASYQGAITAVTNASTITVSPNVGFASSTSQDVIYGSDDETAINNMLAYLSGLTGGAAGGQNQIVVNFAGLRYGVTNAIHTINSPVYSFVFRDGSFSALSSTGGLTCSNGVIFNENGFINFVDVGISSSFLPVNGFVDTVNGQINLTRMLVRNWEGACASTTVTASATSGSQVVTVSDATAVKNFMISRGNTGITDRSMVVDVETSTSNTVCPGSECIVLSKPVTATFSSASKTFYQDAFGVGVTSSGGAIHVLQSGIQQYSSNDALHVAANDNTGCAFYHDGTQSDVIRTFLNGGASVICLDAASAGIDFYMDHAFNTNYPTTETNPPVMLMANQAQFTRWFGGDTTGIFQYYMFGNNTPSFKLLDFKANSVTASPSNLVQFFAHGATAIDLRQIAISPDQTNKFQIAILALGGVSTGATATCGTDYNYSVTCEQVGLIDAVTGGLMLPTGTGNMLNTTGLSLLNGTIKQALFNRISPAANYTVNGSTDCMSDIYLRGTTTTVTLPKNADPGCHLNFGTALSGVVLTPATGATINGSTSSHSLPANTPETCFIGNQPDGNSAGWLCN